MEHNCNSCKFFISDEGQTYFGDCRAKPRPDSMYPFVRVCSSDQCDKWEIRELE